MVRTHKLAASLGVLAFLLLVTGCGVGPSSKSENEKKAEEAAAVKNDGADVVFTDSATKVSFHYTGYLQKNIVRSTPGSVVALFKKRPGSAVGMLDGLAFSTKTAEAQAAEVADAKAKNPKMVCENYDQYGCEKWDQDYALFQKAIKSNDFSGYYALAATKAVINGMTYVVAVTYNTDTQLFQTTYTTFTKNTRITFVDPATGGIEYGIPFSMNAKNREQVEAIAKSIAERKQIADVKTRARTDELNSLVATAQLAE